MTILTREFIEETKSRIAKEFNVDQIELVGSYRRNQATEKSDVDFLILDETAPRGMKYLEMIGKLEDALSKEVGLMHLASMTRPTDLPIIKSMLKDIQTHS